MSAIGRNRVLSIIIIAAAALWLLFFCTLFAAWVWATLNVIMKHTQEHHWHSTLFNAIPCLCNHLSEINARPSESIIVHSSFVCLFLEMFKAKRFSVYCNNEQWIYGGHNSQKRILIINNFFLYSLFGHCLQMNTNDTPDASTVYCWWILVVPWTQTEHRHT